MTGAREYIIVICAGVSPSMGQDEEHKRQAKLFGILLETEREGEKGRVIICPTLEEALKAVQDEGAESLVFISMCMHDKAKEIATENETLRVILLTNSPENLPAEGQVVVLNKLPMNSKALRSACFGS